VGGGGAPFEHPREVGDGERERPADLVQARRVSAGTRSAAAPWRAGP
jgi:hypothetical protein